MPTKRAPTKRTPAPRTPAAAQARTNGTVKAPPGLLPPTEEWDPRPDGTVRWKMHDGITYWLRRPELEQWIAMTERIAQIREESRLDSVELDRLRGELRVIAERASTSEDNDNAADTAAVNEIVRAMEALGVTGTQRVIGFWRYVFEQLAHGGPEFPLKGVGPDLITVSGARMAALEAVWLTPSLPGGE